MTLDADVRTREGRSEVLKGQKVTRPLIERLNNLAATGEIEIERHGKPVKKDEFSALLVEEANAKGLVRENIGGRLGLTAAPVGKLEFDFTTGQRRSR